MDKTMILRPRLSEKAYGLSVVRNTYVIDVPRDASKHTVARAVAAQFDMSIESIATVNISNIKGKPKRAMRKGGRPTAYKRSDIKKAYITLKEGVSLPFFEEVEAAAEAEAEASKKAEKLADKKASKADKKEKK
jgi:large subunit ribosomal protein L23